MFLNMCKQLRESWATQERRDQQEIIRKAPYGWTPYRTSGYLEFTGPEKFGAKRLVSTRVSIGRTRKGFTVSIQPPRVYHGRSTENEPLPGYYKRFSMNKDGSVPVDKMTRWWMKTYAKIKRNNVDEVFDLDFSPKNVKIRKSSSLFHAAMDVDGRLVTFEAEKDLHISHREYGYMEEVWFITFGVNNRSQTVGHKAALHIFSFVLKCLQTFVREFKPPAVTFSPTTGSHGKLYNTLAKRFIPGSGYKRVGSGETFIFIREE